MCNSFWLTYVEKVDERFVREEFQFEKMIYLEREKIRKQTKHPQWPHLQVGSLHSRF